MGTPTSSRSASNDARSAAVTTSTGSDLQALERALHILLTPLDHPDWQSWQVAAHGRLLELTGDDALCVFTPLAEGSATWYAPHLSDAALVSYARQAAADPTWDVIERSFMTTRRDVAHETELMSRDALERSAFFNDFLLPNRILDLTVAAASFGGVVPSRLHFSNRTRRPDSPSDARAQLIRTVLRAFNAGLSLWRQLGARRAELTRLLDTLTDAVLLFDASGSLLHANPDAARLISGGQDAGRLRAEAQRVVWGLGATARRVEGGAVNGARIDAHTLAVASSTAVREVRAGARTYRVRAALAPAWMLGRESGVLVTVEVATPRVPTDDELRASFGLTPRELAVARLVADGLSNQAIADRLGVSFFTARNHVERLLPKLGATSRARVGAILRAEVESPLTDAA